MKFYQMKGNCLSINFVYEDLSLISSTLDWAYLSSSLWIKQIKIHHFYWKNHYNNCSIPCLASRGPRTMKISFLTVFSLGCAVVLSICSTSASAIQYHKWVDAKGVTHYSKTPPPKSARKATTVDTYGWKNSAPTPPRSSETEVQTENTPEP